MDLLLSLIGIFSVAHAQELLLDTLELVGANSPYSSDICFGDGCFEMIATTVVAEAAPIVLIIGTLFITAAGIKLLATDSEDELTNSRKSILIVAFGIILTVLANQGILLKAIQNVEEGEGAKEFCSELIGVMAVFEGIAGLIGIIAIAVTGISVLFSFGGEDAAGPMKNAIGAFLFGAFLLVSKGVIFPALGLSTEECALSEGGITPAPIIMRLLVILGKLLTFLQIAAILILVVLGFLLIVNMGNEEQFTKLKSYLYRLAFGLIVLSLINVILEIVIING